MTGAWFLPGAAHYMITQEGTLLFANVRNSDVEYFNVEKNGVSCGIESKGTSKRLAFSQRFLLQSVGRKGNIFILRIVAWGLSGRRRWGTFHREVICFSVK